MASRRVVHFSLRRGSSPAPVRAIAHDRTRARTGLCELAAVSAVAATQCEVIEINQRDFARLQPQKPQACLKLALAIAADVAAKVAENRELLRELPARKG